jgi:hypothetical protein
MQKDAKIQYYSYKSTSFWDITLCSQLKVNGRFGGIYHLHLQGRKISRTTNHRDAGNNALFSSKISVAFERSPRCHIPENGALHNVMCSLLVVVMVEAGT